MRLGRAQVIGAAVILSLGGTPEQAYGADGHAGWFIPAGAAAAIQDTTPPPDTLPRAASPQDTLPQDTLPSDTLPPDTLAQDTLPQDTLPPDTLSPDTLAQDTLPPDTLAPDTLPGDTIAVAAGPLRLGLAEVSLPLRIDFAAWLPDPERQRPELRSRVESWGERWAESVSEELEADRARLWRAARPVGDPSPRYLVLGGNEDAAGVALRDGPPARDGPGRRDGRPADGRPPTADEVPAVDEVPPDRATPRRGEPADEVSRATPRDGEAADEVPPGDPAAAARDTAVGGDTELPGDVPGQPGRTDTTDDADELLPDALAQYADLGIAVQGRVEMGGGWNRFRPCDVNVQLNCDPGLFPNIKPDIQFGARVGGTISERIHVNVDYDNRREFDAANNINVFYQGLEDEILQRVEVGDVSFQLPSSRYLTQGIPAGNFGFRATGQMGPVEFQTVFAQQKGDIQSQELELGGGGQSLEQASVTLLDDADYERGRFFFLFDPEWLVAYPHIDVLNLTAADAPGEVRPGSPVKVYRYEASTFGINNQIPEGFITATAVAEDTLQTSAGADTVVADTLSGLFRPLIEGQDYILHRSGLWIQLRNTLSANEGLAITYVNTNGTEIGTFDAEEVSDAHSDDPDNVDPPQLELIKGVNARPGTATWDREMHHIYRVSVSPGVVNGSVSLVLSQGDPQLGNTFRTAPDGRQVEFLELFGLDEDPTDSRIDDARIYNTQDESFGDGASGPMGTYLVFRTLEPFKTPPPLRSVGGSLAGQPFPLEPGDRNPAIYDEPTDQVREGASLYLLTIEYRQRFEGFVSTLNLGTGGVREGSERVIVDGNELVRGQDYTIDYDIGQVQLTDPDRWFRNNPSAQVRVTFEQKPLFQLAPTSVFGIQARYGLGQVGELNFIGLSQTERTLQTRPELGLEPSAVRLGGMSGRLNFQPGWLTNLVDGLPIVEAETNSSISLDGEMAVSLPTTNTEGITYVEDFEGGPGFLIPMIARAWRLGSAPGTPAGAEGIAPATFDQLTAAGLVWQDQYIAQTTEGERVVGGLRPIDIDEELQIQGTQQPEPVLFMSVRRPEDRRLAPEPNALDGPAWRSITNVVSPNGQDFTQIEFLEFYVAVPENLRDSVNLIVDLGTVSEDGFGIDSLGRPAGLGQLDREVEPPRIWSNADDVGLWDTGCVAERGQRAYPLGDPSANCTRGNGLEDSEDVNQNGVLDTEERYFRYTVRIGDPGSPYFVREARQLGNARFRLFRIPLRRPDHRERASDAELQNVRHLRFTLVSQSNMNVAVARMRFVGSRWLKRGRAGIVLGLADTTSSVQPGAAVDVGPISTLDGRYEPPPGITNEIANREDQFAIGGAAFNEQSLRVRASELGAGERAEVYLQYPQTPRDLLPYRSLRAWALGVDGPWETTGASLRFFLKLGEDPRNFYLYRTPLANVPADATGGDLRNAWRPELNIDFDRWIALRTRAEEIMLEAGGLPGDTTLQVWDVDVFDDADSTYAVVISQRSRAPNLASVRQISLGMQNVGAAPVNLAEVWVDDLRLGGAVDDMGMVGELNMNVRASDVLSLNARYSSRNPYFRQLGRQPAFRSTSILALGGRLELGRFMPGDWGVAMPLSVDYSRDGSNPLLLPATDIDATRLRGLRLQQRRDLRADLQLSKRTPTGAAWAGWLLDNSSLRFSYSEGNSQNSRSVSRSDGFSASYAYRTDVGNVSVPLFPGPLGDLLFFLPGGVRDSRLRLTPQTVQLSTSYLDNESETRRFEEIIRLGRDSAATAIRSLDERLQTNASITMQPLQSFTGQVSYAQSRELVPTDELVSGGRERSLIEGKRAEIGGLDLGWETARAINTSFTYRPDIALWLTPHATLNTSFRFNRNASFLTEKAGRTVLARDFDNSRRLNTSLGFNLPVLLRSALGSRPEGVKAVLLGLAERVDIFTVNWNRSLISSFRREAASPGTKYQLGFGGFGAFRVQDGDTASRVIQTEGLTLSSGVQLPLRMNLNVEYSQNDAFSWTPNTQADGRDITWPNVRLNWNQLPLPGFATRWVRTLGVRTGYSIRRSRDDILGADQGRRSERRTIPLNVSLGLTTGWLFTYNLDMSDEERIDPTGLSRSESLNHSVQITAQFRPPTTEGTFQNPIRASLRLSQGDQHQCRELGRLFESEAPEEGDGEGDECEPFTDLTTRRVELTLDTDMPPFVLGLQGSWRDQQSDLGERPGSTQLEITVFGQFLFQTGVIR